MNVSLPLTHNFAHNAAALIGLGNPGESYKNTRHNAGFLFVDYISELLGERLVEKKKFHAEVAQVAITAQKQLGKSNQLCQSNQLEQSTQSTQLSQSNQNFYLAKPNTYMNKSGLAVQALRAFYKLQPKDIFVAFDDLDMELGTVKVQFGRGPKTHNGIDSIKQQLGTDQFWHLRIGIDTRKGDRTVPPDKYVLQPMNSQELQLLRSSFRSLKDNLSSRGLLAIPGRA
jgi:PTH1 family peptidyl-tRNA hydrolase